jgi:hypothetical protein
MSSEPQYGSASRPQNNNPHDYPIPSNHRSYETVTSASGSGSLGEPAGYQTDPTSSDNSSIERVQSIPRRQPEPVNDYGIGFGQSPMYQPSTFSVGAPSTPGGMSGGGSSPGGGAGGNNYQLSGAASYGGGGIGAPPVPPHKDSVLRKPIATGAAQQQQSRPAAVEKRKSWFARRFSKNG